MPRLHKISLGHRPSRSMLNKYSIWVRFRLSTMIDIKQEMISYYLTIYCLINVYCGIKRRRCGQSMIRQISGVQSNRYIVNLIIGTINLIVSFISNKTNYKISMRRLTHGFWINEFYVWYNWIRRFERHRE